MAKEPDPIFDFTRIATNRPHLPDAARIGKRDRDDLEGLLGIYLAMALERQYGVERLGWTGLDEESKALAAFNVPPPPDGTKPLKLTERVGVPTAYVKGLRAKIAELDLAAGRMVAEPLHPADVQLPHSMETLWKAEFKAWKAEQEAAEYRAWKRERLSARA